VPLPAFLIDHVSDGCNMEYAEGRARCAARSAPLWRKLPAGQVKDALLGYCSELLGMPAAEMRSFFQSAP